MILWFAGNCFTGAAWGCASSCRVEEVSAEWSSSTMRCPAAVEHNMSMKVDWLSRVHWLASLAARSFLMGTLEGARLCSPSQDYWKYHGKISSSCDNGRWQCVVFKWMLCGALLFALKWMEAASDTCYNQETPIIWTSDSLCHLTATYQDICCTIFLTYFNKESDYGQLVCKFHFTLYNIPSHNALPFYHLHRSFPAKILYTFLASPPLSCMSVSL